MAWGLFRSKPGFRGEEKNLAILFAEVRGFVTIGERLSAEELFALLHEYLAAMHAVVIGHGGKLGHSTFHADAVMAVFGHDATTGPAAVTSACKAALGMMTALRKLWVQWRERGLPEIEIAIGVNAGPAALGHAGLLSDPFYIAAGDNVNLACRLSGVNKAYGTGIIVSELVWDALGNNFVGRELDLVRVKGRKAPLRIYQLMGEGTATPEQMTMIARHTKAIVYYRKQKWEDAIAAFAESESDFVSQVYLQRCRVMKENPPGPDWDGVFTMTTT